MGNKTPRMPTELNTGDSIIRYNLISFHEIDYELFLASDKPEEILFDLLSDFGSKAPELILERMVNRIYETATGSLAFERYISQLRVLVQLRKLQPALETVMEKLTQYFKEQEDPFYKKGQRLGFTLGMESGKKEGLEQGKKQGLEQGKKQGLEQGKKQGLEQGKKQGLEMGKKQGLENAQRLIVLNLLKETTFSIDEIAHLAGVTTTFIEKLKTELSI